MANGRQGIVMAVAALAVVALAAVVVYVTTRGSDDTNALPEPDATLIAKNRTPEFTSIALLAGGPDRSKIDSRVFDLIMAGITWSDLGNAVFPGSEVEIVLTSSDANAVSTGLMSVKADPSRVDALWRDIGQPDRGRPIYLAPAGEAGNLEVEKWLRDKLTSLGFQVVRDASKARERLLFTVTR